MISEDEEILNMMGKCEATNYFEHDIKETPSIFKRD